MGVYIYPLDESIANIAVPYANVLFGLSKPLAPTQGHLSPGLPLHMLIELGRSIGRLRWYVHRAPEDFKEMCRGYVSSASVARSALGRLGSTDRDRNDFLAWTTSNLKGVAEGLTSIERDIEDRFLETMDSIVAVRSGGDDSQFRNVTAMAIASLAIHYADRWAQDHNRHTLEFNVLQEAVGNMSFSEGYIMDGMKHLATAQGYKHARSSRR
ncbi:hypothetical protein B0H67DRAFT_390416 [Lasiosphaeris hirsuta]|uniref:Uncharacterized protein n=1 Tax=Lasiosphaeris hirsuta TaxID=260670 RepID=A0AA39ZS96_9PEZI|nr:hypothetical protein B0H67DRAFT_390416 [Lasiosphaeris hirsuta]